MARILVTGGAGFIGSHIVDELVRLDHQVVVLDNLLTGSLDNLRQSHDKIEFIQGNILDIGLVRATMKGVDYVSHHAAIVSVPKSLENPQETHDVNVTGTLNLLLAAKDNGVKRFLVASSSAVYGNQIAKQHTEDGSISPTSPYGLSKFVGEEYCRLFSRAYGLEAINFRYFNVFGDRQPPNSAYGAVIPNFIDAMRRNIAPRIDGDGLQTRDFVHVANVVQANVLGFFAPIAATGQSYNIGTGVPTSLLELVDVIGKSLGVASTPTFGPDRPGDVKHSLASIAAASADLGYKVLVPLDAGMRLAVNAGVPNSMAERSG